MFVDIMFVDINNPAPAQTGQKRKSMGGASITAPRCLVKQGKGLEVTKEAGYALAYSSDSGSGLWVTTRHGSTEQNQ